MYKKTSENLSDNYSRHLIRGNVRGNLGINSAVRLSAIYGMGTNRLEVVKTIQKENRFRFWWYLLFGLAGIIAFAINPAGWFATLELFVLMINIDLVSRGRVIGIYIGILDCLMYIAICSMTGLWGEVIKMTAINIPLNIVAIVNWTKNLKKQKQNKYEQQSIEIKHLTKKSIAICVGVFLVVGVVGFFLLRFLNSALGTVISLVSLIISSISLAIGVISKVLSGQRYMEAYQVSLVGNIISLSLWFSMLFSGSPSADVPAQIIMTLACLTDSIYGFFLWKKMYRVAKVNGGKVLNKRPVKISKVVKLRRTYKKLYWDKQVDISRNT